MGKYLILAIFCAFIGRPASLTPAAASSAPATLSRYTDGFIPSNKTFPPVNDGFALVELFTSEGCSSCPPADELVASLPKTYPAGVFILSYHVDYWDRLGWKDPFSRADYTSRQRQYDELLSPNNVYTPQAVVNGKTAMVGSDKTRLQAAITDQLAHTSNPPIEAAAHTADNKSVIIDYTLTSKNQTLQAALVQLQASTSVKKGENAGRELRHTNIVRDLKSSEKSKGSLTLSLPAGLAAADCKVILFLQDKDNFQIQGARMLDIH